uniref:NADH-ubiquinone oxidoreductase chain 6 n=1 Tax=Ameletus sp. 1 MT-2014 TaxID=1560007 RepID=A0A0A0RV34_9INSE|nr:NADH dehydrogenase subunit 6 [Ameletus sp. 1 MT-2014]
MFLMLSSITLGLTFTQMMHPLAMGLLLLFQTVLIALMTGLMAPTFWFSYILFLVFLGGMLVLFIYVTSLASNEMFSMSAMMMIIGASTSMTWLLLTLLNDPLTPSLPLLPDLISSMTFLPMIDNSPDFLIKLYHSPSAFLTLLLVLYLFLALIAVVTITNIHSGPLRPKN